MDLMFRKAGVCPFIWPESGFLGGRGRGRHPANDKSGTQRAEAEAERLLEGDMGREAVGGVRGGGEWGAAGAREEEEEHQLRTLRRLEEGKLPLSTFAFMFSPLHIKPSCADSDIQSLAKQIANKTVQIYSVFQPVSRKVLKIMFWKVPMASRPLLWLATAQSDPRNLRKM